MDLELIQFHYSPYNEKARWALDLKGLPHTRRTLLPGPHIPYVKKRTGQTATPVLRMGKRYIPGSAAILDALEELQPTPPLFPDDPALVAQGREIARRFDDEWGPAMRAGMLYQLMQNAAYICGMFGQDKGALVRGLYTAIFPLTRGMVKKGNGITGPESYDRGMAAAKEALNFIAAETAATGYLLGDRFSFADLTAASFLATCADPAGSTMERPKPCPPGLQAWLDTFTGHPGIAWTLRMYTAHRNAS